MLMSTPSTTITPMRIFIGLPRLEDVDVFPLRRLNAFDEYAQSRRDSKRQRD